MKHSMLLAVVSVAAVYAEVEIPAPNPGAGPVVNDWSDFYVTGDFIWWDAQQEGLDFAMSGVAIGDTSVSGHGGEGKYKEIYTGGFKLGAGLNFRYDGWDIYANYTWLSPHKHEGSIQVGDSGALQNTWILPYGGTPPTLGLNAPASTGGNVVYLLSKASGDWKMYFNVLDAELGRSFFVSSKLTLRPHIGFKAAWIDQHNHVDYTVIGSETIESVYLNMKQQFDGFGIAVGMNSDWKIGRWWSVYADFALSGLWSEFRPQRKDIISLTTGEYTNFNARYRFYTITPVLELALGLRYTESLHGGKQRITAQVGWEEQIWFSMNRFINPRADRPGNLVLQGATGRLGFAF